ncbi:hypothetical protein AB0G77_14785 [Streptomyces hygroscopicus]|uniref:hypothetical protein n=1 Tax=Streptomyces hygroscopicus TaxID=1912 RepID=UPI0033F85BF8
MIDWMSIGFMMMHPSMSAGALAGAFPVPVNGPSKSFPLDQGDHVGSEGAVWRVARSVRRPGG